MAKKITMRIELTGQAKQTLEHVSARHGMKQYQLMSRLFEFFASQDEGFQAAMVGAYAPAIQADVARLLLKRGV